MDDHLKSEIEYIIRSFKCPKDFKCYKSGFTKLCKAKTCGDELFIECLEDNPKSCVFSLRMGTYFCKCPLRIYIINKLKK